MIVCYYNFGGRRQTIVRPNQIMLFLRLSETLYILSLLENGSTMKNGTHCAIPHLHSTAISNYRNIIIEGIKVPKRKLKAVSYGRLFSAEVCAAIFVEPVRIQTLDSRL